MGIALWAIGGVAAFCIARTVPIGRRGWPAELVAGVGVAILLGVVATAMDFGGWKEPDWRAGLFAFFGAATAIAVVRLLRGR